MIEWLLQIQLGVCAYCCACVCLDLSGPYLVHLSMDFKIIWQTCYPREIEVPFETFVQVGCRSKSHLKVKL